MRYEATDEALAGGLQVYSESAGLHFMLNFTVFLALLIGLLLWWLGRKGRVLWLQVWSIGLVVFSLAYLLVASAGLI
jgi:hypothetical protein